MSNEEKVVELFKEIADTSNVFVGVSLLDDEHDDDNTRAIISASGTAEHLSYSLARLVISVGDSISNADDSDIDFSDFIGSFLNDFSKAIRKSDHDEVSFEVEDGEDDVSKDIDDLEKLMNGEE